MCLVSTVCGLCGHVYSLGVSLGTQMQSDALSVLITFLYCLSVEGGTCHSACVEV